MRWVRLAIAMVSIGWMVSLSTAQVAILSPRDGEVVRSRQLLIRVQKPSSEGYVMVWLDGKFVSAISTPFELMVDLAEREIVSAEHALAQAVEQIAPAVMERVKAGDYEGAFFALAELAPTIHRFFDEVLVMHEEATIRRNRLALLHQVERLLLLFADFSSLVLRPLSKQTDDQDR